MKRTPSVWIGTALMAGALWAGAEPALTIYNQGFGVVRDTVSLDLKKGITQVQYQDIAATLEPDSVMLRDPAGKLVFRILEQNFRADPVTEAMLLSFYEGKTIDFLLPANKQDGKQEIVKGKVIRGSYYPPARGARSNSGGYADPYAAQRGTPLIEVDGKLRFSVPGIPLFPALADDSILKPTLSLVIESEKAGKLDAELAYVANGMIWEADYNLVAPEKGDALDLTGWVTMQNRSGKTFTDARIKLMAGDVSKVKTDEEVSRVSYNARLAISAEALRPAVTQKTFDEYHLYTLQRPTTLHDGETKQVEFLRAAGVTSTRLFVYDGVKIDWNRLRGYSPDSLRSDRDFGAQSNPKVWVMCEFKNSEANHLGMPLPAGKMRFYRRDADGQLEFIGENVIDHTPANETIRVYLGDAFDIVGERKRTDFKTGDRNTERWVDESFEIKLRNHKKEPAVVKVVEHLFRWSNWDITQKSNTFLKTDAQTMECLVQLKPEEEQIVTYTVRYSW